MLTQKQFDVLQLLEKDKDKSQRDLQILTGQSLGTVNRTVKELTALGYIENGAVTSAGLFDVEEFAFTEIKA